MTTQNKIQRIINVFRAKNIGVGGVQKVLPEPKGLDIPSCSPDTRAIRDSVRRFGTLLFNLFVEATHGFPDCFGKIRIVDLFLGAANVPANKSYCLCNKFGFGKQVIFVQVIAGGKV